MLVKISVVALLLAGPALAEPLYDSRGRNAGHVEKETGGDRLRIYGPRGEFRGTVSPPTTPAPLPNPSALVPPTPSDPCSTQSVAAKCRSK